MYIYTCVFFTYAFFFGIYMYNSYIYTCVYMCIRKTKCKHKKTYSPATWTLHSHKSDPKLNYYEAYKPN